jgi:hypothetical protein
VPFIADGIGLQEGIRKELEKGTGYFSVEGLTRRVLEALRAENS